MNASQRPAAPPPPPSRMTLANITRGKQSNAWRILVYGPEGCGKSTLGAAAPAPVFLCAESGTDHLDVPRLPTATSWSDVRAAISMLTKEKHDFQTLVIDTADWVEPLLWQFICKRDNEATIESYGYGKGFQVALDEWRILLRDLEQLREKRINVLMLGHCQLRQFKNPEGEDFDRYELKVNAKAGGLIKEWCDAVLFANFETFAKTNEKTKRTRGISTGARWLYTQRTAAYDAKNRFSFPELMPLSWPDVESAMAAVSSPAALLEEIQRKADQLDAKERDMATAAVERAAGDVSKLQQLNTWCNSQLTLKAEKAGKQE